MKPLFTLIILSLSGCAGSLVHSLPAWWTAHKVAVVEIGAAAGAVSQVEGVVLNTRTLVKDAQADIKAK